MAPHPTEPYLYCKYSYHMPPEWVAIKNPLDESTANGRVYLSGNPAAAYHNDFELEGHFISSYLVVPIIKEGKVVSNLELVITDKSKSFPGNAQKTLEEFAILLADKL
jgi:hypothetical protein